MAKIGQPKEVVLADTFDYPNVKAVNLYKGAGLFTTEVELYLEANITTTGGVLAEDPLSRLIKTFKITAGTQNFIAIQDPRQLTNWCFVRTRGNVREDSLPTSGTANVTMIIPIHLGIQPYDESGKYNPYDLSTVIPEDKGNTRMTSLKGEMEWGTAADLGTGVTINSAKITVIQRYVILTEEEKQYKFPGGVPVPRMETQVEALTAVRNNRGFKVDLPSKTVVNNTMLMTIDSTDKRSEAEITELGIEFRVKNIDAQQTLWKPKQDFTARTNQLPSFKKGVVTIDWSTIEGASAAGYSTDKESVGDTQIGLTVAKTGGSLHVIHYAVNVIA